MNVEAEQMVVVGIAASAGGLESMSLLAQSLPLNLNCAYILAQHMSPKHESLLSTLLARETRLSVREVPERLVLQPNTIYVPVAGKDIVVNDGVVSSEPPRGHPAQPKPLADRLFSSIAKFAGENGVGIVLSGTGSDGSYGVQDIREAGGITIAQDPQTCRYDSMPSSAMETGCVDLILTPRQIGEHLETILARPRNLDGLRDTMESASEFSDLFLILLARTQVNFRDYRDTTISRRINRRMVALGSKSYDEYVALCRESPQEADALFRDLLISVTRFFRDPEQFEVLKVEIRKLVAHRGESPIRVWIAGCATGEEVYSLTILLVEAMGGPKALTDNRIQVFATDIDEAALARGRAGQYPAAAQVDIPPDLLSRYFVVRDSSITVIPDIRRLVLFSKHNVFQDPPFTNIDLISFRNTLIYFNSRLQERVLIKLQYALRKKGLIFLGTSETLGAVEPFFDPVTDRAKVFVKRDQASYGGSSASAAAHWGGTHRASDSWTGKDRLNTEDREGRQNFEALAAAVAPIGFLTNKRRDIVRIFGDLTEFSSMTDAVRGRLTTSMLKHPLDLDAASMIPLCLTHQTVRDGTWHTLAGQNFNRARLRAFPVGEAGDTEALVLVAVETSSQEKIAAPERDGEGLEDYTGHLESELANAREALQITMEELQTSNEELQSTNEELQSSNEELQSTNEELETSNEELQSTNEELITVNEELLVNAEELKRADVESTGVLKAVPVPLLTVDTSLTVRNASEGARAMFGLRERGSHFGHLSQMTVPKGFPRILDICNEVLTLREPNRMTFVTGQVHYELRVTPTFLDSDEVAGLTLVLLGVPVQDVARRFVALNKTMRRFAKVGTWELDLASRNVTWSDEVYEIFGYDLGEVPGDVEKRLEDYHPDDRAKARAFLEEVQETGGPVHIFLRGIRKTGETFTLETLASAVYDTQGNPISFIGVIRDYSSLENERVAFQHMLDLQEEQGIGFYSYDIANDRPFWSPALYALLGVDPDMPPRVERALAIFPPEARARVENHMAHTIATGEPYDYQEPMEAPDGTIVQCRGTGKAHRNEQGEITHLFGAFYIVKD
ncbi:chemotaxis protein CheB [Pseudooceanicola aestuarii]|uniref:chemotaxis protein CheB n=1 Tax=Pseudooceanicola aestuarii TaxID=2697319 RepID=UPI0013D8DB2E|nr:chemotaxis protein CheB [Pseudooceanicola aestuarii]